MPDDPRAQSRSATLLLAGVAGCVDAIGYATLFRLYTAHMTGNTESASSGLVTGELARAAWHAFPIPIFVAGAMTGALVARTIRSQKVTLCCEALALFAFMLLVRGAHGPRLWLAAAMPAFAMGLQAVTFRRCENTKVQTTFITGMLESFSDAFVGWLLSRRGAARAQIALGVWLAYVAGALTGAMSAERLRAYATLVPLVVLALVAVLMARGRAAPARGDLPTRASASP
jgi:uncharacterized membrane protein YoaK (UPF0700 family)